MKHLGAYVDVEFHVANFAWFLCSVVPPSCAMSAYFTRKEVGHDAVMVNSEKGPTTDVEAQVPIVYGLE